MSRSHRRLLSVSWVGQGDFGDEAMAYAMRQALAQRSMPLPTYYQQARWPRYVGRAEPPLRRLHPHGRVELLRRLVDRFALRAFDTVIIGGGSLFHSLNSVAWKHQVVRRIRERHGARAVTAAIGVSVGPFATSSAEHAFGALARDLDVIVTRDAHSAALAQRLGASNVVSAVDLSFLLPRTFGAAFPRVDARSRRIGISIVRGINDATYDRDRRSEYFMQLINALLAAGHDVRLFTLYVGDAYLDLAENQRLRAGCSAPDRVDIHEFDGDVLKTAQAIAGCAALCAQRLHAMLFAYLTGVPFVSLGYHRKNADACATLSYPLELVLEQHDRPDVRLLRDLLIEMANKGRNPFAGAQSVEWGAALVERGCEVFANACDR